MMNPIVGVPGLGIPQLCSYRDLKDGSVSLAEVAMMNNTIQEIIDDMRAEQ